ncbi:MAG: hypothetical protein IJR89_05765 [Clostridia bacterium]|nr:hypothetical protein [Clostridia bacterium]
MKKFKFCSLLLAAAIVVSTLFTTACDDNSATATSDMQSAEASVEVSAVHGAANGILSEERQTVRFGFYPQDANGNSRPIEWIVLTTEGENSLLVTKNALIVQPFIGGTEESIWQYCALRTWLNDEFYNHYFTSKEIAFINITRVVTERNPDYHTYGGDPTQDRFFLLSLEEVNAYFANDEARKCAPTKLAFARGVETSKNETVDGAATCRWWLRTPGGSNYSAACVNFDGSVSSAGELAYKKDPGHDLGVRPAVWIKNLDFYLSTL